ncbi:hypothetical protein HJC23_005057 [Cyclotella cryptica]|uniref:HSF-type DNA-binding domain-containing protein n=1 Tax=Cyclotella cryptica TaxID=29204 RepID=A0ABD3QEQ0_9STRA|eukprot:CCRYP_006289-RA/>CCRYP_006289-RA protein AED:0.00 eAED:0.00 QI:85/-1/1/1/-1/1/1/313/370
MDCSKIAAPTTADQAARAPHCNEAKDAERVITTSADGHIVFLLGHPRAVMQYPKAPASSPWQVVAGVCAATPNGSQLFSTPIRNPANPQIEHYCKKEADPRAPVVLSSGTNRTRNPSFAYKLHAILMDKHCNSAISWLPSGDAFCIMDKEEFTKTVLPKYFRETKFESFTRRIKRWGFHRMYTTRVKQVIYSHDLFKKDRVDLCKLMNGRAGQAAKEDGDGAAFNPSRFETVKSEQVALVEKSSPDQCESIRKKESEHERLQTIAHRSILSSCRAPVAFGDKDMVTTYHHMSHKHPMEFVNFPTEAFIASHGRYPMHEFKSSNMPNKYICDLNVVTQLSSIDEDIADCEHQLAILHRLKILRDKRRSLHN